MDQVLQQIGKAFGDVINNQYVQLAGQGIAIYFVVLWLAAAYWAFRDMQLRAENPLVPYLAASFVILSTPLLFPAAVFVYRIVRPQEKIGEVYERNLAEEALLAEVEAVKSCPTCARRVHDDWIICPTCRTRLNRVCPNCSRLVGLDWSLCAWCGKDFERREAPAAGLTQIPAAREAAVAGLVQITGPLEAVTAAHETPPVRASLRAASSRSTRSAARPSTDPLPER